MNQHPSTSLGLLTDLYQLTMAYGYWRTGRAERLATFHLYFRNAPFKSAYAVTAGLGAVADYLDRFHFDESDTDYLAGLKGNDGESLFEDEFLSYLRRLELCVDIDAMPEGTIAFGGEPILRVTGPIAQGQLLETALLNIINFQTLIATKANRIVSVAGEHPVLEFGLRRSQGIDGGLSASRAAYVGGCSATSNVLAGKTFGIPVKGTHAHSWVMSFQSEHEAFEAYANSMPGNCVFLVDTYDTLEGINNAIDVGQKLRARGHEMIGIRLDSGDLAYLSNQARQMLDKAGFPNATIVASNDLDEHTIESLISQGASINVWGVGTKLATAYDQPALGGVYKLGAIQDDNGNWQPRMKFSDQTVKMSIPGQLQVYRFVSDGLMQFDMIDDDLLPSGKGSSIIDPNDPHRSRAINNDCTSTPLLRQWLLQGERVSEVESLASIRQRVREQCSMLDASRKRLMNPHEYPVGLSESLHRQRERLRKEQCS
ncbi:MAG: nicotinate phosphoribosyltransferase [Planctomycetota bacterium]